MTKRGYGLHFFQCDDSAAMIRSYLTDNLFNSRHSHIGCKEDGAHFVKKRVVDEAAFLLEEISDIGPEQLGGLGEALLEFIEESHGVRRPLAAPDSVV